MKFSHFIRWAFGSSLLAGVLLVSACATDNEPETDPIFDVTPGGQNSPDSQDQQYQR